MCTVLLPPGVNPIAVNEYIYEVKSNENIKYFFIFYHGRYGVLIHDSYPDVLLFHSLLCGDFPSRWLEPLQWPLVSLVGVPDQAEESLLQNYCRSWTSQVHSYTCCSDRHASPYWTSIRRWISMCFTPSLLKKRVTERCSSLVQVAKRGRHLYTTTAPSCCIPASYCHLSATLQTISMTAVNLQDNRAVFRIFIALLKLLFDSPSYLRMEIKRRWIRQRPF